MPKQSVNILIVLSLITATLLVYWQVQNFEFVNYDDGFYAVENIHVQQGLTWENLRYAFTERDYGYWHPLTWLSLMADRQLFLNNAGGYHWTSLLFHITNIIILFLVLKSMTGAPWRSAFVAALFALHPLHVEAVAWIAARKDVLSGFFWMLSIGAYALYVKKPSVYRYLFILFAFALGMMAKPTVATLPFVLLLLDYWPLRRNTQNEKMVRSKFSIGIADEVGKLRASWLFLITEKIPLIVLGALLGLSSFFSPAKATGPLASLQAVPLLDRLQHTSISYIIYLIKTFYPINLVAFYPRISHLLVLKAILAICLIIVISLFVFFKRKKYPYLTVGWLWYLGTLLPVIGLIQVWTHEIADRYTYLPLIGIFIIISWGISEIVSTQPKRQAISSLLIGFSLVILMTISWRQISYWQNSYTLWNHALEISNDNPVAHNNMGLYLANNGRPAEAAKHYRQGILLNPDNYIAYNNLGIILGEQGNLQEACSQFHKALSIKPNFAEAHNYMGIYLAKWKKYPDALNHFLEALRLKPDNPQFQFNAGLAYLCLKKEALAGQYFKNCLSLDRNFIRARQLLDALGYSFK